MPARHTVQSSEIDGVSRLLAVHRLRLIVKYFSQSSSGSSEQHNYARGSSSNISIYSGSCHKTFYHLRKIASMAPIHLLEHGFHPKRETPNTSSSQPADNADISSTKSAPTSFEQALNLTPAYVAAVFIMVLLTVW